MIRVLVADGDPRRLERLAGVLRSAHGIEVVGTAEDGRMACSAIVAVNPDVVLLGESLEQRSAAEVAVWTRQERPRIRVVAVTDDQDTRATMRTAGAVCAFAPDAPDAEVTGAVLTAVAAL